MPGTGKIVDGRILLTPAHSERMNLTRVEAIEISSINVGRGQIDCAEGSKVSGNLMSRTICFLDLTFK